MFSMMMIYYVSNVKLHCYWLNLCLSALKETKRKHHTRVPHSLTGHGASWPRLRYQTLVCQLRYVRHRGTMSSAWETLNKYKAEVFLVFFGAVLFSTVACELFPAGMLTRE